MKVSDFNQQTEQFFHDCMAIMNGKGLEYSGNEDKFANFKKLAAKYNVPVEEIWGVYFTKHIDSIDSFIRKRREGKGVTEIESGLSEPMSGRIADAINYLFILKGMIDEQRENDERTDVS